MSLSILPPRSKWRPHLQSLQWEQGQHIPVIGPTNSGKTTIARDIVETGVNRGGYALAFMSKTKDPTIRAKYAGWERVYTHKDIRRDTRRALLWPEPEKTARDTILKHRAVFRNALDWAFRNGGWILLLDETHYLSDAKFGGLAPEIAMIHHVGRSSGISAVTLFQRPAWVPKIIYSSASHAYVARTTDSSDLKIISELGGDVRETRNQIASLENEHDFLYIPTRGAGSVSREVVNAAYG